jgi:outer membrane protein TolC
MHRPFLRALALAAALAPCAGTAQPLTLARALELAVERSPALDAARAGVRSASEAARGADRLPDPMLRAGIENLPVTGPDRFSTTHEPMTMKRIGVSQEWTSADKRAARRAAADAVIDRERVAAGIAEADARLQVALAYVDAYYAERARAVADLMEHHAHEELETARARLASGAAGAQDVLALVGARGSAEDESSERRQGQAVAVATLERWTGVHADALVPPTLPAGLDEAAYVRAHPAVRAAQADAEMARRELASTGANRRPDWTWEVSYGQRTGLSDLVTVGVSIPLPVDRAGRQDRDTAARLALVERADASLADAQRSAAAEWRALDAEARALEARIARYADAVQAPARQRTAAARAGYAANQLALPALFEARHAEAEAERRLLMLQRDLARVQAQLAFRGLNEGVRP